MSEHDQVRDGGENQTQRRKDHSAPVGGGGRSFVGEGPANPDPRERDDEVDPSVSHGGADSDDDRPDAR